MAIIPQADSGAAQTNPVIWYDGTKAPLPQGALLTNNPGYWGEVTATDVTYSYPEAPTNPPDVRPGDDKIFGNRLLDGQRGGDWNSPVGIDGKPLVVDFDFHQIVSLRDVVVNEYQNQDLRLAQLEVRNSTEEAWQKVFSTNASKGPLHRMMLPQTVKARYVRVSVQSTGAITFISQIWMWGEAKAVAKDKHDNGFSDEITKFAGTEKAVPGDGTILTEAALADWRKATGAKGSGLTWQNAPSWQNLKSNPLQGNFLPEKATLRQPVQLKTTRNQSASGSIFLINASDQEQNPTVKLSPFKNSKGQVVDTIQGELFTAGSIWTRRWGQTLRPLFSEKNKLGGDLMEKYLTNGSVIKDFPTLHLPSRGTALLWASVRIKNAEPGTYRANITTGTDSIPIELQVLPVTLPNPDIWLRFWGNNPASNSNMWTDETSLQQELEYQSSMGASVRETWPSKGTSAEAYRSLSDKNGRKTYYIVSIPADLQGAGYNGQLTSEHYDEAFRKRIADITHQYVEQATQLGLTYDDWSIELWDEPNVGSMPAWVALARMIRAADPKVNIYMNPLFWTREGTNPEGFVSDERQVQTLSGWYNELVDISVPIMGQTNAKAYPEANRLFYEHQPRKVRAFYIHPNPGRNLSWEAFSRGFNGWGSYAYFAPRKDPWDDFDHPEFDYQIVYPGPNGYIPTIESEEMRASWDDYRLLTLLKEQGKDEALAKILKMYQAGVIDIPAEETPQDRDRRSNKANELLPYLHDMALSTLAAEKN